MSGIAGGGRGPQDAISTDGSLLRLDDMEWPPSASGVGSLLVLDTDLPRDEFGHPYQPLFWFDEASQPIGLVTDFHDHVLAWASTAAGDPLMMDPPRCRRVPEAIEQAARCWWSAQQTP